MTGSSVQGVVVLSKMATCISNLSINCLRVVQLYPVHPELQLQVPGIIQVPPL